MGRRGDSVIGELADRPGNEDRNYKTRQITVPTRVWDEKHFYGKCKVQVVKNLCHIFEWTHAKIKADQSSLDNERIDAE